MFKALYYNYVFLLVFLFCLCCTTPAYSQGITDEAQRIYRDSQNSVYQIQVIDLATGKKSSIGSGFQFTAEGHIATNYHVVGNAVQKPERYRIESINFQGDIATHSLVAVDVVHDLAILRGETAGESFLELGDTQYDKGASIFTMGNPYDLGMTIVEGIFNGLMEKSLYQKILFSGSINSGMSGGPAMGVNGKVMGVNVSTQGNQISFLVPVAYLQELFENSNVNVEPGDKDWFEIIETQLKDNQDKYMKEILENEWDTITVGEAKVPGEISSIMKCWGDSENNPKVLFELAYVYCSLEDDIFIHDNLVTGSLEYRYNWMTSKGLGPTRFYNQFENYFAYEREFKNALDEADVNNFECTTNFVEIDGADFKISMCTRKYLRYPALFDLNLSLASVGKKDRGLIAEVFGYGLTQENIQKFISKFLGEIKWPN